MGTASICISASVDEGQAVVRAPLSLGEAQLFAIFAVEAVALDIARRPIDLGFTRWAFFDFGANLSLQSLIAQGYRPGIDFGYTYGLLAAQIARVWFWCFGLTPAAYQWAMLTGAIFAAWALARIFAGRKIGAPGLALLIVSFGFAFQSSYQNISECVEAVVLAHALALQVRESYRGALALATVAVFDKPAMGYVYGALLLILIVVELRRQGGGLRDFIAAITPAAIAFVVLSIALIAIYGAPSFFYTIVPITGARAYRLLHFGFIQQGRHLWKLEGGLAAYFLDVPGWWMSSTWYLMVAAAAQVVSCLRGKALTRGGELIVTCALLHLLFVSLFFGPPSAWYYYSYLLAIGCGLATEAGWGWRWAAVPLCVLATLAWYTPAAETYQGWTTTSPNPTTAGLWSTPAEASEWNTVLAMARQKKIAVVDVMSGVSVLYPEFGKPAFMFLGPGIDTPEDIARTVAQLSTVDALVVPSIVRYFDFVPHEPELNAARNDFDLQWKGQFFEVYQRSRRSRLMSLVKRQLEELRAKSSSAAPAKHPIAQPSGRGT